MMSGGEIRRMQQEAAAKASRQKKTPFMVWPEDLAGWKTTMDSGKYPQLPFPFIGEYVPKGFTKVNEYFVDSSGFGREGEPALTITQFFDRIRSGFAYAITEVGQFQIYIAEYAKEGA